MPGSEFAHGEFHPSTLTPKGDQVSVPVGGPSEEAFPHFPFEERAKLLQEKPEGIGPRDLEGRDELSLDEQIESALRALEKTGANRDELCKSYRDEGHDQMAAIAGAVLDERMRQEQILLHELLVEAGVEPAA